MFCRHCGATLRLDSKFCEACGKPLDVKSGHHKDSAPVITEDRNGGDKTAGGSDQPSDNQENKKDGFSGTMFFVVIAVTIVALIGIMAVIGNSSSPSESSNQVNASDTPVVNGTSSSNAATSTPIVASQQTAAPIREGLQNTPANTGETLSTSFISQIEPAIVLVVCFPPDFSTSGELGYGSGVSVDYGGVTYIETNYHVYNAENTGGGSPTCFAYYPGPAPDYSINSHLGGYQLVLHSYSYDPETSEDAADFILGGLAPSSTALASLPVINKTSLTGIGRGCSNVNSGDRVIIFGYPASGNYLNVSETVTQGTISGQTPGPIYKFDGAIDHGNSGGLAVLSKSSCDLGIPTLGVSGLTAGTGYIQSIQLARTPVTLSNDQICQNQYGINSDYVSNNSQGGLTCGCTSGYTWNSNDTACVQLPPETGYQVCAETYPNETWNGTYNSSGGYNCVCDAGYSAYNGVCVSDYTYCTDTEGYGASYDSVTNSCTCDSGYIYSGGQCVSGGVYCSDRYGTGAEYDYATNGCTCEYGYEASGNQCVYVGY